MADTTQRLLERFYRPEDGWVNGTERYVRLLRRHVPAGAKVLEVGPGDGSGFAHAEHMKGSFIVGVDPDPAVKSNALLSQTVVGTVEQLPFEAGSFDAVVCSYVIEHVRKPMAAAREICRVLRPNGVLVFRTPNLWHYVTLIAYLTPHAVHKAVANWARGMSAAGEPCPTRYGCNTRRAVQRAFGGAGMRVVTLEMVEAEPSYMRFSPVALLLGVLYERLVNCHRAFEPFRANILGVLRKDL